jgi:Zn-dependent protease
MLRMAGWEQRAWCVVCDLGASNRIVNAVSTTNAAVLPPEPAPPEVIHNCPSCSHWLPEGTLACPDCQTLTYGVYLSQIAYAAQALEQEQKWAEARERWTSALRWLPEETPQAESVRLHVAQIDARLKAADDQKARWTRRLGPFAPIALFLLKIKSAIFLLFKLKFLLSFLAFFGIYWVLFGWKFAAGFIACLFLHEMGHYVALKRRGLKADLPVFVPMMGAYVRWYSQGVSLEDLASISLAGPFAGLLAAVACYGLFVATHAPIFMVLVYVGAWVNFLNLFPLLGLDGAQATFALSRLQRGLIAGTCLVLFGLSITNGDLFGQSTLWIFLIVGLGMAWRCLGNEPEKPSTKTFLYFQALVLILGVIVYRTQFAGMAAHPAPGLR